VQPDGFESMFYLPLPSGEGKRSDKTLFNPHLDILFLQDPPNRDFVSSLSVICRWLDNSVLEHITSLALPYYTWRKDRMKEDLSLLMRFKRLERVWVCFVGGGSEEGRRGWLSAVNGENGGREIEVPHLKQVEEQVRGDVEGLARGFPGWKRPRFGFVMDKSELRGLME